MGPASIVKFKVQFVGHDVPTDPRVDTLRVWCERFNELGLTPMAPGGSRALGNLSFRLREDDAAFVITGSTLSTKERMASGDFVTVLRSDLAGRTVYAAGTRDPSSESMMHYEIYRHRPEVMAIFHGHDRQITAAAAVLGVPETAVEQLSGTPELLAEVMQILGRATFVVMKNHGFLSLGRTMDEAGQQAIAFQNQISQGVRR
jgi:ribulose-5-phosphate 4-epimerase/fuculose-1-phosphate aldolase